MKGSRLPETWELPEDWKTWAIAQRPDLDVSRIAEEFKDYWIAKSGKAGIKVNWLATWRNWIRRQNGGAAAGGKPMSHRMYKSKPLTKEQWDVKRARGREQLEEVRRKLHAK